MLCFDCYFHPIAAMSSSYACYLAQFLSATCLSSSVMQVFNKSLTKGWWVVSSIWLFIETGVWGPLLFLVSLNWLSKKISLSFIDIVIVFNWDLISSIELFNTLSPFFSCVLSVRGLCGVLQDLFIKCIVFCVFMHASCFIKDGHVVCFYNVIRITL